MNNPVRLSPRRLGLLALGLALGAPAFLPVDADAGVVLISTRKNQDAAFSGEGLTEERGPGLATPGDVAMGTLLADNGYSFRLVLDANLNSNLGGDPAAYLNPADTNLAINLVIWSGSSSSADVPQPPDGIPLLMGEHVTLGNRADRAGSIYLYAGQNSNDPNESSTPPASHFMKVVAPDHPILKGIPVDAQGRIKIFRDAYPAEESHVPPGGKRNFEYRWCTQAVADKAAGTTVLGVLDGAEDRSCLAVAEAGAALAEGRTASARLVHMFTNENGSGGSRRVFLALTGWGRLIFTRAAQWAMGETLAPYQALAISDITTAGVGKVALAWPGSADRSYRIEASTDAQHWQTIGNDIPGHGELIRRTLDVSAAPGTTFFQVVANP